MLKNVFIQSMGQHTFMDSDLCTRHFANSRIPRCMKNPPVLMISQLHEGDGDVMMTGVAKYQIRARCYARDFAYIIQTY